ncbi:hypothetical protein [Streptomyces sp. bgisy082]|uniref:hypothetical protein n=1 Tax=Streptomyces sp. bgisy082 TaxID=3413776 RepID=UPI003D70B926
MDGLFWTAGDTVVGTVRGASGGVEAGAGAGGAEAVVVQSAPGARRVRRTTGRRWTGALGVPPGVPGPVGETGPGTFWGRSAAEGSGAAVGTAGVSTFPGVGAGATGPAAPAGARRRGGCTGRAEISGERRTGRRGVAVVAAVPLADATARRTGGVGPEAAPRTGAAVVPSRPTGTAAAR